jgi:hypothetical protein
VKYAAGVTDVLSVASIPMEIQLKIPSETSSPRKTYSAKGSMVSASSARIWSSALVVSSWVLVE